MTDERMRSLDPDRMQRVLLLIYTDYAGHLPTHVLVEVKSALWPEGDGPTVPEARLALEQDS